MTKGQRIHFFADLWNPVCRVMGWNAKDDAFRLEKLGEWLGRPLESSRDIGLKDEFDKVKGACLAILKPADVNAQVRQIQQPLIRLRFACQQLAPEAYRNAIMRSRFGTVDLEDLNESQLTQLRNTLAARANSLKRRERQEAHVEPAMAMAEIEHDEEGNPAW